MASSIKCGFEAAGYYEQINGIPPAWREVRKDVCVELIRLANEDALTVSIVSGDQRYDHVLRQDANAPSFYRASPCFVELVGNVMESAPGMLRVAGASATKAAALAFPTEETATQFCQSVAKLLSETHGSTFDEKTDKASSQQYFHYYGQLAQQQNMLQDLVRTGTYQRAMLENAADFHNAVVLDVGSGTGILSHFALQAGARKVYAVEASNMAETARALAQQNKVGDRLVVIKGKVEDIELTEQVDIIISEPMGILLVNERMLESFVYARKWLKPTGIMLPTMGTIYYAPFQDDYLFMETFSKSTFWCQHRFYGVNMSGLHDAAVDEYFGTPVVDAMDPRLLLCRPMRTTIDFMTATEDDLATIRMPVRFEHDNPATVHGLVFWFDVVFAGSASEVVLSTGPYSPLTHWYQVRCLLRDPLQVPMGGVVSGEVLMTVNKRQSYDIKLDLVLEGTDQDAHNVLNLKDPFYRCADYSQSASAMEMTGGAAAAAAVAGQPDVADMDKDGMA